MKNRVGKLLVFVAVLNGLVLGEALAQPDAIPPPISGN
jgi:hypothetical protein